MDDMSIEVIAPVELPQEIEVNPLTQPTILFQLPNMSSTDFQSSSEFNTVGMQMVYYISNLTLNAIFPTYDQYLGYLTNYSENTNVFEISRGEWEQLVWDNKGPLGYILGCLVFILILTLWGVGWLFSKCCCGDKGCCVKCLRSKDSDDLVSAKLEQKRDKCKRNFCGVIFATVVVVFMFGLVCCFVTNEQMRISVEEMPEEVDNSLEDVDLYLNTSQRQINALFIDNYLLLSKTLNHILDESGEIIKNGLSKRTGAQTLDNLTDILDTVEEVRSNVLSVEKSSKSLKEKVERLKNGLNDSRTRLLTLLDQCQTEKCIELKSMPDIRSLRVHNDFQNALAMYYPKLPNMTEILRELQLVLGTDVRQSIERGKQAFNDLGHRIKTEVEPVLPDIRIMIDDTGTELANVAKSLTKALSSVPVDDGRQQVRDIQREIEKYAPFRYYAVLGVCLTLAFIFTLLTLGIFVGFCGRQPGSDYSNECCSRKTGSSFINCGIFFMFLTGGVLMAVATIHFILAGTLTQVVCEAINAQDNRTQEAFRLPTLRIESRYNYQVPPYHEIVKNCKEGASAYEAFQLQPVYDIEDINSLSDRFKRKARTLANQVTLPNDATENIIFLSSDAKQQLARFSRSKINKIKFDNYANQLEESIVSVDLRDVIHRFNETIEDESNWEMPAEVKARLQNEILILESLQEKILTPMVAEVKRAADSLRYLFNQQKDLAQRIDAVAEAAEKAQEALQSSGARQQVRQLATEFEGEFVRHVEDYANFTYLSIRDTVGHCEPLYKSLNATTTTFCHKIGSPLSAFWFSMTALLLLFIPLIIIGMVLARLYRKYKYLGYESEAYYSTYGDGDTIPLSLSANGRRQKRGREREPASHSHSHAHSAAAARFPNARFEDTSQNMESVFRGFTSSALTSSSPPQSVNSSTAATTSTTSQLPPHRPTNLRFIDTPSHKAWGSQLVFNNHHTPPASGEYERPPPYYYPGPAN